MKLFNRHNRSHSLMFRVFLITFIIVFAAFLLVSFYSGNILYENSFDDARNYSFQLFEQIGINISNYLTTMDNIAAISSRQSDILSILLSTASPEINTSLYYQALDSGRVFLNNLCVAQDYIRYVTVVSDLSGYYVSTSSSPLVSSYDFREQDWYRQAMLNPGGITLLPPHIPEYLIGGVTPVISYVKPLSVTPGVPPVGIIIIDLSTDSLAPICNSVSLGENGYSYIINSDGKYIYYPGDIPSAAAATQHPDSVYTARVLAGNTSFVEKNSLGVENGVFSKAVPDTDWYVVGVVPYSQLNTPATTLRTTQIIVGVIVAAIVSVLLAAFSNSNIFRRLFRLKNHMNEIRHGNLDVAFAVGSNDEIGELGDGFNQMTAQLRQLIADVAMKEQQKRHAEFAALQAQINPHFLYNTLDSIVWMAEANPAGASEMAYMLASFFRLSLSRGADIVPLSQELEHTETYLHIQKIRYENYFDYEIRYTQDVASFPVPKLIVQPLVENAIYHGIKPSGRKCMLFVHAFRYKDFVFVQVSDDGAGIPASEIDRILSGEHVSDNSMSGVGVSNVDERVKLYYPEHSGLFYRSNEGRGTLACIYIYDKPLTIRHKKLTN